VKLNTNGFHKSRIPVLVSAILFFASTAFSAVPQIISYQGTLSDSGGAPINATLNITFTFYDAATLGTALWQEVQSVDIANGVFSVQLGVDTAGNPLDPAFFEDPLFLGIAVDGDSEMAPRQELAAVGYAFRAKSVESDTLNSLSCANGEVPKWNGSAWACSADDNSGGDITGVTAGDGLTGGGISGDVVISADLNAVQKRVTGFCPAGQSIRVINANGSVSCEVDSNNTYVAGDGLSLSGPVFFVPNDGIKASHLSDDSVGSAEIKAGAVGSSEVAFNSLTAQDLASNSVGSSEIAPDAVGVSELSDLAKGVGVNGAIVIPAGVFQPTTESMDFAHSVGYIRPGSVSTNICIQAPVVLPDGVTITHFDIVGRDNSVVNSLGPFQLRRIYLLTGGNSIMASVASTGSASQTRLFTDSTINSAQVDGINYSYYISGCIISDVTSVGNLWLTAARIRYN